MLTQNVVNIRTAEDTGSLIDKLSNAWCTLMHDSLSWLVPIHASSAAGGAW
jgi:hypothetical protein